MKKKRGSALIIAMLLITAVGGIAFGIARLLFMETSLQSISENGIVAYYAAESGLEEGFLRYRYDKNAEVPFSNWTWNADESQNKVFRTNLSTLAVDTGGSFVGVTKSDSLGSPTEKYYDLRMGYAGMENIKNAQGDTEMNPLYGNDADQNGIFNIEDLKNTNYDAGKNSVLKIPYDESVKIDLPGFNSTTQPLSLYAKYYGYNSADTNSKCNFLLEVKFLVDDGRKREYKALVTHDPLNCPTVLGSGFTDKLMGAGGGNYADGLGKYFIVKVSSLQRVITDAAGVVPAGSKVTLYIKPLTRNTIPDAAEKFTSLGLAVENCVASNMDSCKDKTVPSPHTRLESTGYFGGASRKLMADIDRQSGTLYDLYDYVIYKTQ